MRAATTLSIFLRPHASDMARVTDVCAELGFDVDSASISCVALPEEGPVRSEKAGASASTGGGGIPSRPNRMLSGIL